MKSILIFINLLYVGISVGQDLKKDFSRVFNHYNEMVYYTQNVLVSSFQTKESAKAIFEEKGKIVKGENTYYSSMLEQETIVNGSNFLHINEASKQITYYGKVEQDIDLQMKQYLQILDSLDLSTIKYLGIKNNIKTYQISSPNQLIKTTEISINTDQKLLSKIVYYYSSTADYSSSLYKTVIEYEVTSFSKPSSKWFDLKKYVSIKNKKASLNSAYKNYVLLLENEKKMKIDEFPK
jgi:hypothetical protein